MPDGREDRIRRRAHEIWESEGRPDGRHEEHWQRAAQEMQDAGGSADPDHDPAQPAGGLSSDLQSGGTVPGGGPAAGRSRIGSGGSSTAGKPTGSSTRRSSR